MLVLRGNTQSSGFEERCEPDSGKKYTRSRSYSGARVMSSPQRRVRSWKNTCQRLKSNGSEYMNGVYPFRHVSLNLLNITNSSGDTGVSASLIFHGTPPFQVYYRTQRDKEDPRNLFKTFTNSRGELTLQPEHSGHYFYTFLHLSDANYKKVELKGPSIDQIVHPLAAADFVPTTGTGRSKRMVNSCSGNMVDIEVDLRVS